MNLRTYACAALLASPLGVAAAQAPADTSPMRLVPTPGISAGSDREDYLRTLQVLGVLPLHQWSIRAFGPAELARFAVADSASLPRPGRHDWCAARCGFAPAPWASGGLLPVAASSRFNTSHPFGMNDGVVWAGRGVTLAATAGAWGRLGPVSLTFAPIVTWAQNQEFPLQPNGFGGALRFGDEYYPEYIDHPQRFGDDSYTRADLGESTLRVDLFGGAAGISTAAQWWGPMSVYPFVMGNNAGGFPHVFLGTSTPVNIGIGRLHARVIYGELAQSAYSAMPPEDARRFASALTAVFTPRGLENLELGGARFYHALWPDEGISGDDLRKPFEGLLKENSRGELPDDVHNQLASVFGRLTLPASGVEVYGEFGREDHNADLRDFWLEPDHSSYYGLGLRRAWRRGPSSAAAFTIEAVNLRTSHLARVRGEGPPYFHHITRQGHTQRGQPLGIGLGARAGDAVSLIYRLDGQGTRSLVSLSRHAEAGAVEGAQRRIRFIGAAERSMMYGPLEIAGRAALAHRMGREENRAATNLSLTLEARWWPHVAP